jgi:hypothetical protein
MISVCDLPGHKRREEGNSLTFVLKEHLERAVNDKARKITLRGREAIVPLKFDEDGNPATVDKLIFKRLTLNDLRFLQALRQFNWDSAKACEKTGIDAERGARFLKKLSCFREEDAKVRALCEIPTPEWIAAKHVENIYDGGTLEDSQHKSLAELAKIEGAYKQTAPASQVNVFNINLTPEQEAALKPVFDSIALEGPNVPA